MLQGLYFNSNLCLFLECRHLGIPKDSLGCLSGPTFLLAPGSMFPQPYKTTESSAQLLSLLSPKTINALSKKSDSGCQDNFCDLDQ